MSLEFIRVEPEKREKSTLKITAFVSHLVSYTLFAPTMSELETTPDDEHPV